MLRDTKNLPTRLSTATRLVTVGALLCAGAAAAGLRSPASDRSNVPPPAPAAAEAAEEEAVREDAERRARRAEARRIQSENNARQIMVALHNYRSAVGHFPPAVVIGPDGKTPHSWRVALLPLLDQTTLYLEYRKNEPWDSPHNRRLLEKIPDVYRNPGDAADSTNASYFVVTGPETVFAGEKAVRFEEILDGVSNTIFLVEARRDIPWTKPEDVPYDTEKEVPRLGGFHEGGFVAGLGDARVEFLPEAIDEPILRALFTKDGREAIEAQFLRSLREERRREREAAEQATGGRVTYRGEPVEGATVRFEPQSGSRPSTAVTDAQGRFRFAERDADADRDTQERTEGGAAGTDQERQQTERFQASRFFGRGAFFRGSFDPDLIPVLERNPPLLATIPQVQEELKLTDEQKSRIAETVRPFEQEFGPLFMRERMLRREAMQQRAAEAAKQVDDLLTDEQRARLEQVWRQLRGSVSLTEEQVARTLNLTAEQQEKIRAALHEQERAWRERVGASLRTEQRDEAGLTRERLQRRRERLAEIFEEFSREAEAAVREILTQEQHERFEQLKGEPFELRSEEDFGWARWRRQGGIGPRIRDDGERPR